MALWSTEPKWDRGALSSMHLLDIRIMRSSRQTFGDS